MWFLTLLTSSVALGAFAGWLATHTSSKPAVFGRYSFAYFLFVCIVAAIAGALSLAAFWPVLNRRLYAIRREVLLVTASFAVPVMIVEVLLRLADPFGISSLQEASRYHLEKMPDSELVYKHRPGLHRVYQGVTVTTNELGLRDRPLEQKGEREFRLLMLGDSVTFGWGVAEEDTFVRRLEKKLAQEYPGTVRTVNAGVGSYNTVIEAAFLKKYVDVINPDVVILLYTLNDIERIVPPFDPWSARSLSGKSPPETLNLILGRSWTYRLGLFVSGRLGDSRNYNPHSRSVRESMVALRDIALICREKGIKFITFVFRRKQKSDENGSIVLFSEVAKVGAANGFPTVDVAPWWSGIDMRSVTNSVIDSHPNAKGHEILAAGIAESLAKEGFIAGHSAQ
jgi:hypothetical protein